MNSAVGSSRASRDLSLSDLTRAVWGYKWRILIAAMAGFVAAAAFSLTLKPVFRGSVVVAAADSPESGSLASLASQFGGLAALGGLNLGSSPDLDQSLAVLQSVPFIQKFVTTNDVRAELFPDEWDPETQALKAGAGRGLRAWLSGLRAGISNAASGGAIGAADEDSFLLWEGYRRFMQRLHIQRDRRTQLVTIGVDASSPNVAAVLANNLVSALNAEMQSRAISESEARLSFLNERIPHTTTAPMEEALYRLIESEQKSALVAHTRSEYALRVLGRAIAPDMRVSPHRSLIALAGGFAAGFMACLLAIWFGLSRHLGTHRTFGS